MTNIIRPTRSDAPRAVQSVAVQRTKSAPKARPAPAKVQPPVDQPCPHRGGLLGQLDCACGGKPAVLACTIHGRCVRQAPNKPTPYKFVPLVGETETLDRDHAPAVCARCLDGPSGSRLAEVRPTLDLSSITLACIDCVDPSLAATALDISRRGLLFARVVLFSHKRPDNLADGIEFIAIPKLNLSGYNRFCLSDLHRYVTTPHVLTIQTDGYVMRPDLWDPAWASYDYIGAPWRRGAPFAARSTVGNSGFCLRSLRLLQATAELFTPAVEAECVRRFKLLCDDFVASFHLHPSLLAKGMKFAPESVASRFSYQSPAPAGVKVGQSFGFHGKHHEKTAWLKTQRLPPRPQQPRVRLTDGLPSHLHLTVATVCRVNARFTPDVVRWFRRQLSANLRTPHEFICLTDRPDQVPGGVALQHDWPGWWAKLELFRPGLFADGEQVLYFDLDTVFTKPFHAPTPPRPGDLGMVLFGKAWWTHYGSGVMNWLAPLTGPYDAMAARPTQARAWFPSDQELTGPTIYAAGGDIVPVPGCEVQPANGTTAIPRGRPRGPIWCAAGSGAKPWETKRDWIPPLAVPDVVSDTALVSCWFGHGTPEQLDAACRGAAALGRLHPRPAVALLVEAGGPRGFPWNGEHLPVAVDNRNDGIWIKEALLNLGARHVLTRYPSVSKILFCDLDTHPEPGGQDWLLLASDALARCDVCHPWTAAAESNGHGRWISYSAQVAAGLRECRSGQGFAVGMTVDWFRRCSGWPGWATAGSGDAVACLQWDVSRSHWDMYRYVPSMTRLVDDYDGPRTNYGTCTGTVIHEYHGDRDGPKQTRNYMSRHVLWDRIGGMARVVEFNDASGLPQWRATPLAEHVRRIAIAQPRTEDELRAAIDTIPRELLT